MPTRRFGGSVPPVTPAHTYPRSALPGRCARRAAQASGIRPPWKGKMETAKVAGGHAGGQRGGGAGGTPACPGNTPGRRQHRCRGAAALGVGGEGSAPAREGPGEQDGRSQGPENLHSQVPLRLEGDSGDGRLHPILHLQEDGAVGSGGYDMPRPCKLQQDVTGGVWESRGDLSPARNLPPTTGDLLACGGGPATLCEDPSRSVGTCQPAVGDLPPTTGDLPACGVDPPLSEGTCQPLWGPASLQWGTCHPPRGT